MIPKILPELPNLSRLSSFSSSASDDLTKSLYSALEQSLNLLKSFKDLSLDQSSQIDDIIDKTKFAICSAEEICARPSKPVNIRDLFPHMVGYGTGIY